MVDQAVIYFCRQLGWGFYDPKRLILITLLKTNNPSSKNTLHQNLMSAKPDLPKFLLAVITLLSSGCESTPLRDDYALLFSLPKQWNGNGQSAEPALIGWLEGFGDAYLILMVRDGLAGNFDLKAAAARVDAAREQTIIAGAGRWPQLSFAPGYRRSKDYSNGFSGEYGAFSALFNLGWEMDVWGRIKDLQQAAGQEAYAVTDDYRAAQLSLAARIAQTYFELTEAQLQAAVAEQSVKDRGVIADLVRGRFNKGLSRGLDLRLVLTDLANAEAQLAQTRNNAQTVGRRLQTLLGRYPDNMLHSLAQLPRPPQTLAAGLPAELLERRPDVVAAFKRLRAADARLQSAEKALLPRITLTAAGGASSPALTELVDPRAAAWNLATGLTQPLFTGGRLQAEIRFNQQKPRKPLTNTKV